MQIIYLYDLKSKGKKPFARLKRSFYYHFHRLEIAQFVLKTKSALAVPLEKEKRVNAFFKLFKGKVVVYKIYTEKIEEF